MCDPRGKNAEMTNTFNKSMFVQSLNRAWEEWKHYLLTTYWVQSLDLGETVCNTSVFPNLFGSFVIEYWYRCQRQNGLSFYLQLERLLFISIGLLVAIKALIKVLWLRNRRDMLIFIASCSRWMSCILNRILFFRCSIPAPILF